jgi:hypothetical protein
MIKYKPFHLNAGLVVEYMVTQLRLNFTASQSEMASYLVVITTVSVRLMLLNTIV